MFQSSNFLIQDLKEDGNYYLPNALGVFIRSSNVNGKGKDPEKNRKVGSIQYDAIKNHKHKYQVGNAVRGQDHNTTGGEFFYNNPRYRTSENNIDGGSETRPINISMYTYIKISN